LDARTHACITMGYFEDSKSYRLFDPIKRHNIIIGNVFFDEKYLGIKLLNASPGLLQDGPFNIVDYTISHIPFFSIWTKKSNSSPVSSGLSTTVPESIR